MARRGLDMDTVQGKICTGAAEGGFRYEDGGFVVLDLHGSWQGMGRQYGALAGELLNDVLAYLDGKLSGEEGRMAAAREIAENLYSLYPEYLNEFFNGMSETSSISLDRLKLCNAVEYVEPCFFCSAMAAWGDYSGGKLVFGRNYDAESYSELAEDVLVTVFHPENGLSAATIGYAGEIYCVNGFNEKGLFVELNNGMPSAGSRIHWDLPASTTLLMDILFQASSIDDLDHFFIDNRSFASFTIAVADKNEARSYEWCHDGVKRGDAVTPAGLMVSTNHYVNPEWDFAVPSDARSWNSISRRCNLLERAGEFKGVIDVSRMQGIMGMPLPDGGPLHDKTRYQIVVVPQDMMLFLKLSSQKIWAALDMDSYFRA